MPYKRAFLLQKNLRRFLSARRRSFTFREGVYSPQPHLLSFDFFVSDGLACLVGFEGLEEFVDFSFELFSFFISLLLVEIKILLSK